MKARQLFASAALGLSFAALPAVTLAQTSDDWRFRAIIYGYFPDISGKSTFASQLGRDGITIDANDILSNLKFTFMGTFEAQKGRWGFFTDLIYMDIGDSKSRTRDLTIGNIRLPEGVAADLNLDLKGVVWTLAGTYRVATEPDATLDVLAGARLLDLKQTLGWQFSADLGPVQPTREGSSEIKGQNWDAIIGVKGRYAFGEKREWFVPLYVDVGTGESQLTWQIIGGLGYQFSWGDVVAGWRYLDYNFKSSSKLEDLSMNGPIIGVAFRW